MKRSVGLAVFLVFLFTLSLIPAQRANATQAFTEKITAYIAGSDALWFMSFNGVNASAPAIAAVEGESGVSWYNLTALKTSSWSSDFEVFGPNGYNLVPVPFIPSQGAFLTIGADSYSAAFSAAASFDSYLLASFASYSNSSGTYTFYSPLSFSDIVPSTLLNFIPSAMGGFASMINTSSFESLKSPIISLQGVKGASGFANYLTLGSIVTGALSSSSQPTILTYFGATSSFLEASNRSSSSIVYLRFLDGDINSTDRAAISSDFDGSGSYKLSLSPGEKVYGLNVTVDQLPPLLLARRAVDKGVLMPGQNVSVTISLSNPVSTAALRTAGFSDDWWESYGFFKLVEGNSTIPAQTIAAGSSQNPTYVLEYTGSVPQQLTVPPTSIAYSYDIGSAAFKGNSSTNPVTLSLGRDDPIVYAYLMPAKNYEGPVGSVQRFNVTVINVGTLTAPAVAVAGQQEGGLVAGNSLTVPVAVTAQSLLGVNSARVYTVSYSTPAGQNVTVSTNSVPLVFSHSGMNIGLPFFALGASVSRLSSGKTNLTLAFVAANQGTANLTGLVADGQLPAGLACGKVSGPGITCSGDTVKISLPTLSASAAQRNSIQFDLSSGINYIFAPFTYRARTAGFNVTGVSDGVAAPSGVVLAKQFVPSSLFAGMSSTVHVSVMNPGPFALYNATVQSSADFFDAIAAYSPLPLKFSQMIGPGNNLSISYSVVASGTYGNLTSSPATVGFYFGGNKYSLNQTGPSVNVYRPVTVSVNSSPSSPTEGKPFSMGVYVHNPSNSTVSNVRFSLPIPLGVTLSNLHNAVYAGGNLTVSVSELEPQQSFIANATAQASSGITILSSSGTVAFSYSGATVRGTIPQSQIVIGEDVLTRYTIPSILVLIGVVATALYIRRRIAPTSLGSQQ